MINYKTFSKTPLFDVIKSLEDVYLLGNYQKNKCDEFFKCIKIGEYIYPGHLKSIINVDIKTAYKFMEDLKNKEFVVNIYEIYCTRCEKSKGVFLNSVTEFNRGCTCDFCNNDLDLFKDLTVLYKIIKNNVY